jgi:hypothetical protein
MDGTSEMMLGMTSTGGIDRWDVTGLKLAERLDGL